MQAAGAGIQGRAASSARRHMQQSTEQQLTKGLPATSVSLLSAISPCSARQSNRGGGAWLQHWQAVHGQRCSAAQHRHSSSRAKCSAGSGRGPHPKHAGQHRLRMCGQRGASGGEQCAACREAGWIGNIVMGVRQQKGGGREDHRPSDPAAQLCHSSMSNGLAGFCLEGHRATAVVEQGPQRRQLARGTRRANLSTTLKGDNAAQ